MVMLVLAHVDTSVRRRRPTESQRAHLEVLVARVILFRDGDFPAVVDRS